MSDKYIGQYSFDELYMQYHGMVYNVCMSVTHDAEQSRDIAQEVFIKLLQWWGRIEDMDKIKGWLCVTAKNMAVNHVRRERTVFELHEDSAAGASDPEAEYIRKEQKRMIENALSSLDEKYTEVLSMKYMLGFSVREIAAATRSNSATVYTRLRRGERALERMLANTEIDRCFP